MSIIDTNTPSHVRIGDNRHSPIHLLSDTVTPYVQRSEEHRKTERKVLAPLERANLTKTVKRIQKRIKKK